MKLAVMQPYFFPYLGYFQLLNAVDKFILYDDVNYIKKGWVNRNNILVNNQPCLFTIPVQGASQNKLINTVELLEDDVWRKRFLKTLEMAYKKAPFFPDVFTLLTNLLQSKKPLIIDLIEESLQAVAEYLGITTEIVRSSAHYSNQLLKGQDRILDICAIEKTTNYINPIGGQELYSKAVFQEHHIELNFIKTRPVSYKQHTKEFVPWLSFIDIMMYNSPNEIKVLLNEYDLI